MSVDPKVDAFLAQAAARRPGLAGRDMPQPALIAVQMPGVPVPVAGTVCIGFADKTIEALIERIAEKVVEKLDARENDGGQADN